MQHEYQFVTCGGDDKGRDELIAAKANERAIEAVGDHPCGCIFCWANCLLHSLHEVRKEHGVDPNTGKTISGRTWKHLP